MTGENNSTFNKPAKEMTGSDFCAYFANKRGSLESSQSSLLPVYIEQNTQEDHSEEEEFKEDSESDLFQRRLFRGTTIASNRSCNSRSSYTAVDLMNQSPVSEQPRIFNI